MSEFNPIDLLFGGMEKLGPGGDLHTLHVLRLLPTVRFTTIVDAGCGTGRQTIALARELRSLVHAVDTYEPFLKDLARKAAEAGLAPYVQVHHMDMADIPKAFPRIDLLWSEGSAYNIGFSNALEIWWRALVPGGFLVVSELCWLDDEPPEGVRDFFRTAYPAMQSVRSNQRLAEGAGYDVLTTYTLPPESWVQGYYDVLEPRARALLAHEDSSVRDAAAETLEEIDVFRRSEGSYGYVFFVLQRPDE